MEAVCKEGGNISCNFPEELLHEILSRVPVENLIKFMFVCRRWQSIISDPAFIKAHPALSQPELFFGHTHEPGYIKCFSIRTQDMRVEKKRLKAPQTLEAKPFAIRSSCNGLLLLQEIRQSRNLYVYNPITGLCKTLPPAPSLCSSALSLVHDASTGRYKLFAILQWTTLIVSRQSGKAFSNWKYAFTTGGEVFKVLSTLVVENELHWTCEFKDRIKSKFCIYSVGVSKEKLTKIVIPFKVELLHQLSQGSGQSLCITNVLRDGFEIWALQDRHKSLWNKQYYIPCGFSGSLSNELHRDCIVAPVIFVSTKQGVRIFIYDDYRGSGKYRLTCYDVNNKELKEIAFHGKEGRPFPQYGFLCRSLGFHINSFVDWE